MKIPLLALMGVLPAALAGAEGPESVTLPSVRFLPDAWPKRPRNAGQKAMAGQSDQAILQEGGPIGTDAVAQYTRERSAWRIVGAELTNHDPQERRFLVNFPLANATKEITLASAETGRVFVVTRDQPDVKRFRIEVLLAGNPLVTHEVAWGEGQTGRKWEADVIVAELQEEQKTRHKWLRRPACVQVRDEDGYVLPDATLTLVHKGTGLTQCVKADAQGIWTGLLLGGTWDVTVRAVSRTAGTAPAAQNNTVATRRPDRKPAARPKEMRELLDSLKGRKTVRLYCFQGQLAVAEKGGAVLLVPDRAGLLQPVDREGRPAAWDRLSIVPAAVAPALRFEDVYAASASDYVLAVEGSREAPPEAVVLSSAGMRFEVMTWAAPAGGRAVLTAVPDVLPEGEVVVEPPPKGGALVFETSRLPGCERLEVALSLPEHPREVVRVSTTDRVRVELPDGPARVELTAVVKGNGRVAFCPYTAVVPARQDLDLSPLRLSVVPHYQDSDRGLMVWAAVLDQNGRVVGGMERTDAVVRGVLNGAAVFEEKNQLTLFYANKFVNAGGGIRYEARVTVGGEELAYAGPGRPRREFAEPGARVVAPDRLEARAKAIMALLRGAVAGAHAVFDFATFDLTLFQEIVMPPGLGGLGGGGMVLMSMGLTLGFGHLTDRVDGIFTHEFGHCLGFGHDPYMCLAAVAVEQGVWGEAAYALRYGRSVQRLLDWLDRKDDAGEWQPSPEVFAAFRLVLGPAIHKQMFARRATVGAQAANAGLSIPECMAAFYSDIAGENTAWMFRAFGWPVFDYRVTTGGALLRDKRLAGSIKLPPRVDGNYLNTWWVRGPLVMKNGRPKEVPPWTLHAWEGRYLRLAEPADFLEERAYHCFTTLQSNGAGLVLLSIASDCQVNAYLNGNRLNHVAASPQMADPQHEAYTMERGNATVVPVVLCDGVNALELTVIRPAGSKGMYVMIAGMDGKPVATVGAIPSVAPDGATRRDAPVKHPDLPPVYNPSFEEGGDFPADWILGLQEGAGTFKAALDPAVAAHGTKSLRMESDGEISASAIQRLVVEEGATYELQAAIRTEGFSEKVDRAWVMLFAGSPITSGGFVKTEIVESSVKGWAKFRVPWKADRRQVYIGCLFKAGRGGRVWFDSVSLVKVGG